MKTLTTLFLLCTTAVSLLAQMPSGFNYQAVARDNGGAVLANQSLDVRFGILSGSASGTLEWEETHTVMTNDFGLFTAVIGEGTSTGNGAAASFDMIDWASSGHWLHVEVDPGTGFVDLGTTQFLAVPYATTSQKTVEGDDWGNQVVQADFTLAGTGLSADLLRLAQQGANQGDVLKWSGASWSPDKLFEIDPTLIGTGTAIDPLGIAQQGANIGEVLKWSGFLWSPEELVQKDASLAGNGTAGDLLRLAQQGANQGNVLKWSGTAWAPDDLVETDASLDGDGSAGDPLRLAPLGLDEAYDHQGNDPGGGRSITADMGPVEISSATNKTLYVRNTGPDIALHVYTNNGDALNVYNPSGNSTDHGIDVNTDSAIGIYSSSSYGTSIIGNSGFFSDSGEAAIKLFGGTNAISAAAINIQQGGVTVKATGDQFVGSLEVIPGAMQAVPTGMHACLSCSHDHPAAYYQDVTLNNAYLTANSIIFLTVENIAHTYTAQVLSKAQGTASFRLIHVGQIPPAQAGPVKINYMIINKF